MSDLSHLSIDLFTALQRSRVLATTVSYRRRPPFSQIHKSPQFVAALRLQFYAAISQLAA
jgi:hypothetical protein